MADWSVFAMHSHWLFIYNVGAHLVASMSGVASFIFAIIEHARGKKIETWAFSVVGAICLIVAFDQAWQDEHRNSEVMKSEKATAVQEMDFWKQQTYDKDSALRQRDALLAQNYTALIGEQATANKTQDSLATLSTKILDISKPPKQKFTIGQNAFDSPAKPLKHFGQYVVTSNLPIRADIFLKCTPGLTIIDASIVSGGPHFPNTINQFDPLTWRISIPSPPITPETPLIITMGYDEIQNGSKCDAAPQ
jgi:hypothetical protein